ncbi:MAG: hypothetical protein ACXAD7_06645, partial [Candidatus Kariarchaeaceae archaeon]
MALNWTIEVYVSLVSVIPVSAAFIVVLLQYISERERNRSLRYLMMAWFGLMLWVIGEVLTYLLLSKLLFIIHIYFFVACAFFVTLLMDSISKERVGSVKIAVMTAVSTLVVFTSFDSGAVKRDTFSGGEDTLAMAGDFRTTTTILSLLMGFIYAYYMAKVYFNAPEQLKFYGMLNLLGGILLGVLPVLFVALELTLTIPGIHLVAISLGALLSSIAFAKEPKLSYILPFKAINITIIQINSGIPVYTHSWSKQEV